MKVTNKKKSKKKRCLLCKKSLKFIDLCRQCKCDLKQLCSRCYNNHTCTFDYHKNNKDKLTKQLVQSIPTKLDKI